MAENKFQLQVITPEEIFYDESVERVIFRTSTGDVAVLKDHIPLTTSLRSGIITIFSGRNNQYGVIHQGFAEIRPDKVTILTDAAEWPEEIDLERAKKAKEIAEEALKKQGEKPGANITVAKMSLTRALARIEMVEYHNKMVK
ncbi:ATP synthase F1 subunit epsilon [Anaerotalea alkaliphila]|uniref:ATP synthase epsilon chain n=1 Tax=Anaerotalea alkaliphila TaxID=2662126 RepID=A0A7X5KM94_9FIRM|nr:ATP synthase F1 subunit epsilon [Anaerotalea alkaliphila]NDL66719.1 ATP synthase F1 subunit epsilon [Anaerotalea alkaliphila]